MNACRCLIRLFVVGSVWTAIPIETVRSNEPDANVVYPGAAWFEQQPAAAGLDEARLDAARRYALIGGGSGCVVYRGRVVMRWGDQGLRYDLKSTTKSIGATVLGVAMLDGKLKLEDLASKHHPTFGVGPNDDSPDPRCAQITLKHLATQTAGFEKPGGYTKLQFTPGTAWCYSDGGPNWLAECVTLAYREDAAALLERRVFRPIGIKADDLKWRKNSYRPHEIDGIPRREFGSGVSANVEAMARLGYFYLRGGRWNGKQLLDPEFVRRAGTTDPDVVGLPEVGDAKHGNASDHYGLLWWNNADGTLDEVPRDAYWSWGLYDSLIVVVPSLDLVVARAGKSWKRNADDGHYDVLRPFLAPIVAAIAKPEASPSSKSNVLPNVGLTQSPVFAGIEWAPADTVVRKARGGDNWPITWGDDDRLYTAYGDARGFEPFVLKKLSLGLAEVEGSPPDFVGTNITSSEAEAVGDGPRGRKASGLLMVDGVLYMLVRNVGNAQLAWSQDRGRTWTWADWKFTKSFGCPTFVNFGRNYAGARDEYVYIVSHDDSSAYRRADRMVLARVPKNDLMRREGYEFFVRCRDDGTAEWSRNIAGRGAVFENAGRCYRSSISYNAPQKRYLWCQTGLGHDPRYAGGLTICDAPEPWGPWTVTYHVDAWDMGPGETSCLPTKWMSADGLTVHLVFSGNDSFSVRRGILKLRD